MSGLRDFARVIGVDIEQYISKINEGRVPFEDLLAYASHLTEKNTPPKTAGLYMLAITNFLEFEFDYELSRKQRKQLRNKMPRGKRARTVEDDLTRKRLRKILTHCDAKGALFYFLASSGIRIGEALQLELDDIDLESVPAKVNVRGEYTKSGEGYYSFITEEAQLYLDQWLRIRPDYLKSSEKRGLKLRHRKKQKPTVDNRIFPFHYQVATMMWNNALLKTGLKRRDKGTNRRTLHIHMLRKFFNSQLKGEANLPRDIVEVLMGHEEGLDGAYRRYTPEQIKEWYQKGEPYLTIDVPKGLTEMRQTYDKRIEALRTKVEDLDAKNIRFGQEIKELTEFKQTWEKLTELTPEELAVLGEIIRERLAAKEAREFGENQEMWRQEEEEIDREQEQEKKQQKP